MKKAYTLPDKVGGVIHGNEVKCLSSVEISGDEVILFQGLIY